MPVPICNHRDVILSAPFSYAQAAVATFFNLKSATSKRDVPLNDTAIEMILDLRNELYFDEDSPLIPDENGIKQPDGLIKSLTPIKVADLLGHTNSEITELYYVKRELTKLNGITDGFEL